MRGIALTIATVSSIGAVVLGDWAISAERADRLRRVDAAVMAAAPADRLWYGGTLEPITVVARAPERAVARPTAKDTTRGS